jgi:N-acetylneuraminic acid mutarotase
MEFYLFSGRTPEAGKLTRILSDAYVFNPRSRTWRTLPVIGDGVRSGLSVMAGTAAAVGDDEIFLFGGDRGNLFQELEEHDLAIAELQRQLAVETLEPKRREIGRLMEIRLAEKKEIYRTHPGFAREILAFNTRMNTWRVAGHAPFPSQVTTVAVKYNDTIVIPSGEVKPGIRTADIIRVKFEAKQ